MTPVSDIHYVECDVPPGQTLSQWRNERAAQHRRPAGWLRRRRATLRALRRRIV